MPELGRAAPASIVIQRLLDRIQTVDDTAQAGVLLGLLAAPQRTIVVSFVNQHALNVAWTDAAFLELLGSADVLLRDGLGIGVCLRLLGRHPGVNMNGTDLIPMLVAAHAGRRVAVFGTRQPWLDGAATVLRAMGCEIAGLVDGFQPDAAYIVSVRAQRPDFVILAMGMPKQERVAAAIARAVDAPMLVVNGGAIADFLAGRFPRAPRWMRRAGLEWAFRLSREPTRLWRRYLTGGAVFLVRVGRLRLQRVPSGGVRSGGSRSEGGRSEGDRSGESVGTAIAGLVDEAIAMQGEPGPVSPVE